MTKTAQQLAEELARKCALDLHSCTIDEYRQFAYVQASVDEQAHSILQSIPLVELLELISIAEQSLTDLEVLDMFPEQLKLRNKCINITTKLKQLGIEI